MVVFIPYVRVGNNLGGLREKAIMTEGLFVAGVYVSQEEFKSMRAEIKKIEDELHIDNIESIL